MNAPAVAVLSAVSWGSSDFLGGVLSRRVDSAAVVLWSQVAPCALLLVAAGAADQWRLTGAAFAWGLLCGVFGAAGLLAFYRALSIGTMSVIAPIAACGAIIPVIDAVVRGHSPGGTALVGATLALVAVVVISRSPAHDVPVQASTGAAADAVVAASGARPTPTHAQARTALVLGVVAATGFGLFFLFAARASGHAPHAPIVVTLVVRAGSIALQLVALAARRTRVPVPPARMLGPIALVGIGDSGANLLYIMAARSGNLAVVSVLGSLYPAITVLLAAVVLRERVAPIQRLAVGLILVAVVLMASGGG